MATLEIRLLGELTLLRDGVPVELPPSRKTRALLAYLILKPGPERRERLCELFWQRPDDPRGALRWSLSKLRALVDGDRQRLFADRERVRFEPAGCRVDVLELRERVAGGLDLLPLDDLARLAAALSRELLDGLDLPDQADYHYFLAQQRRGLAELRGRILRNLADRSGDGVEAIGWLQALVALEPYEVELHRRLIQALALAGRRKEAERQRVVSLGLLKDVPGLDPVVLQRAVHVRTNGAPRVPGPDEPAPTPRSAPLASTQEIRFCRSTDGVQIAWATVGDGPPLVKTANWLNHLEYDWESPVWRHVFRDLAHGRRLIRYDARGNGLSDWDTDDYSFEAMVRDLEAVVDAAGLDRFALFGLSQGCAVSAEYAVRHPERVSKLILVGGYAKGWKAAGSPRLAQQVEAMITLMRIGWGQDNPAFRQMFTSVFMPDAPPEQQSWFNELQRITTSPENAARLVRAIGDVDVRERLARVRAPTLVLHARHEIMAPFAAGRELAAGIPGARIVGLESRNHLIPETDPAWARLVAEIDAFLAD